MTTEDLSPIDRLRQQASFMTLICRLSGVPLDRYEDWLDSMSEVYFAHYVQRVFEKDMVEILSRIV